MGGIRCGSVRWVFCCNWLQWWLLAPRIFIAILTTRTENRNNQGMETDERTSTYQEIKADAQTIADCVTAGRPVPAEVVRRVRERAERARLEVLEKHGILNIGVPAIRELRG